MLTTTTYIIHSQNLDDVREEWERVKFSYEILIDPKSRKSYDRNSKVAEVLEDPTKAVGRAVVGGTMSGLGMVLGGAFKLGEMATKKVYETAMNEKKETPPPATTPSTIAKEESTKTLQTKEESSNTGGPISMEAMRQMNMEARKNANGISASNDSTTSERDYASVDTKSNNADSSTTADISTPVSKKEKAMKKTADPKPKATTEMNIITSNPSASTSSSSKQKKKKNKKKRRKGGGRGFG